VRPILTAEAVRGAEQRAIDSGTSVETLMERAGAALAEAALGYVGKMPALVLVGPGNNGGDGYVAARHLAQRGVKVRVAALAEPKSAAARWARGEWNGDVETLGASTEPAPLLVDCLFGTGLKHGLETPVTEQLSRLSLNAQARIACDIPSGVESDTGAELSAIPDFDVTVTFGALKPGHRLMPAMHKCGRVVLADIGIEAHSDWHEIGMAELPALEPDANKYSRGLVSIVAGQMPGAAALAASAAARTGAGTVRLYADERVANVPAAVVQGREWNEEALQRGVFLVGPGLGRDSRATELLRELLGSGRPLIIDADALRLVKPKELAGLGEEQRPVLTPHRGEFETLFGKVEGSKARHALDAARSSGAVIVYKGPDTLVASPDGRLGFAPPAPAWLASAGTGDVLAGIIAAMRARGLAPFEAACAAVWLHGRAAEVAGPHMIADDLVAAVPRALDLLDG
jgi:ADP-dependent NAD(P)H-hydrate dehydratase / NAD(P)H-hydrate epimerase